MLMSSVESSSGAIRFDFVSIYVASTRTGALLTLAANRLRVVVRADVNRIFRILLGLCGGSHCQYSALLWLKETFCVPSRRTGFFPYEDPMLMSSAESSSGATRPNSVSIHVKPTRTEALLTFSANRFRAVGRSNIDRVLGVRLGLYHYIYLSVRLPPPS